MCDCIHEHAVSQYQCFEMCQRCGKARFNTTGEKRNRNSRASRKPLKRLKRKIHHLMTPVR